MTDIFDCIAFSRALKSDVLTTRFFLAGFDAVRARDDERHRAIDQRGGIWMRRLREGSRGAGPPDAERDAHGHPQANDAREYGRHQAGPHF
jgi:hypothetical protein